jgi:hypothetical protein
MRVYNIVFLWLLLTLLLYTGVNAQNLDWQESKPTPDVVIFQNGDRLSGTITSETATGITLTTEFGASVTIPRGRLIEIQRGKNITPTRLLSPENAAIQTPGGDVAVINPGGSSQLHQPIVSKDVASKVIWRVSAGPSLNFSFGTQRKQALEGHLSLRREQNIEKNNWHHQRTTLFLDATNTLTKKADSTSTRDHAYDGSFVHMVKLTENVSLFGIAEAYHNNSLKLYLQQSYGGGLGFTKQFERQVVEFLGDVRVFGQHFYSNKPAETFTGVRIGEDYSIRFTIKKTPITFFETINYIQPIDLENAWQIRGAAGLVVPINEFVSIVYQFNDDYFQNVPNGRKNYTKTGLVFKFALKRPKT